MEPLAGLVAAGPYSRPNEAHGLLPLCTGVTFQRLPRLLCEAVYVAAQSPVRSADGADYLAGGKRLVLFFTAPSSGILGIWPRQMRAAKDNSMKVADLTVDALQALIRKVVNEELQGIIADPDKGLELTEEIEARLQSSLSSSERVSYEEVKSRLNLA